MNEAVNYAVSLGAGLLVCALFAVVMLFVLYAALAVRFAIRAVRSLARGPRSGVTTRGWMRMR